MTHDEAISRSGGFVEEIEAVQAYYSEGRPLAERLAWEYRRMEEARIAFNEAERAFIVWDTKYDGRLDAPVYRLLEALQRSVDYVPPPFERWMIRR